MLCREILAVCSEKHTEAVQFKCTVWVEREFFFFMLNLLVCKVTTGQRKATRTGELLRINTPVSTPTSLPVLEPQNFQRLLFVAQGVPKLFTLEILHFSHTLC